MSDLVNVILRTDKGEELTWEEMDTNLSRLRDALNYLLSIPFRKNYNDVGAGRLEVVHNKGLVPINVLVWQKVTETEWIPVATPGVIYKEESFTTKVFIDFPEAMGSIKVYIKF
jgi:hypothetical protein